MPETDFRFTTHASDLERSHDDYDDKVALATAENAVAVYTSEETYRQLCKAAGFEDAVLLDVKATQVGVSWTPASIVVAARGSSERGDWRDDFRIWRVGWRGVLPFGCRIHRGFKRQLLRIGHELRQKVLDLKATYPQAKLYVTGHSLGGALTPLIVTWLAQEGLEIEAAYAHEMPRTGNRRWAEWYDQRFRERTFRVVNVLRGEPDVVTRVPKRSWGYRHLGRPQILAGDKRFESAEKWQEYRKQCPVGSLEAWRILSKLSYQVQAHLGKNLLETLRGRVEA